MFFGYIFMEKFWFEVNNRNNKWWPYAYVLYIPQLLALLPFHVFNENRTPLFHGGSFNNLFFRYYWETHATLQHRVLQDPNQVLKIKMEIRLITIKKRLKQWNIVDIRNWYYLLQSKGNSSNYTRNRERQIQRVKLSMGL